MKTLPSSPGWLGLWPRSGWVSEGEAVGLRTDGCGECKRVPCGRQAPQPLGTWCTGDCQLKPPLADAAQVSWGRSGERLPPRTEVGLGRGPGRRRAGSQTAFCPPLRKVTALGYSQWQPYPVRDCSAPACGFASAPASGSGWGFRDLASGQRTALTGHGGCRDLPAGGGQGCTQAGLLRLSLGARPEV